MSESIEVLLWEFAPRGAPSVHIEHAGITEAQAAQYLIGAGALPSRQCSCCGALTPLDGTRVRLVRVLGGSSRVEGEWRTYPLSRQTGREN